MYLLLYGAGRNDFDAGKSNVEGHWKGWALKIETFFSPEMATRETSAIWAQKSRDFQGPPLPIVRVMDFPASKSLRPSAILKNRYIGNFMSTSFCILYSVFCIL